MPIAGNIEVGEFDAPIDPPVPETYHPVQTMQATAADRDQDQDTAPPVLQATPAVLVAEQVNYWPWIIGGLALYLIAKDNKWI